MTLDFTALSCLQKPLHHFPLYITSHMCTHTEIYMCMCAQKFDLCSDGLLDAPPRKFTMEAWPLHQDILAIDVQLWLPTNNELKVLETVALTSYLCQSTSEAFSVILRFPAKPFSSVFCKFWNLTIIAYIGVNWSGSVDWIWTILDRFPSDIWQTLIIKVRLMIWVRLYLKSMPLKCKRIFNWHING